MFNVETQSYTCIRGGRVASAGISQTESDTNDSEVSCLGIMFVTFGNTERCDSPGEQRVENRESREYRDPRWSPVVV